MFDKLWQSHRVTREAAYILIERTFGVKTKDAHIRLLDADQCRKLIEVCQGKVRTGPLMEEYFKRMRRRKVVHYSHAATRTLSRRPAPRSLSGRYTEDFEGAAGGDESE